MRGRLLLAGGLLGVVLLAGLAAVNGRLLALALPLAVYLGSVLLFAPEEFNVSVQRVLSTSTTTHGQRVTVSLALTNAGSGLDELLVEDDLPPGLEVVDGAATTLISLAVGETRSVEYTVLVQRGSFLLDRVHLTGREAFGIYQRRARLSAPARLLVLPEVQRLRRVTIRPRRTRDYSGSIPAHQGGAGIDFFSLREYQPGDPLRWLNWKAAARHAHTFYTNQFEVERIADVGIILDARQQLDVVTAEGALFEHAVRAAASLADVFLGAGNRVGLMVYGWGQTRTFPGYGHLQRERILRALAKARTSDNLALQNLGYLPVRFFPVRSQIVMVSPLCEADLAVLFRLRALDYSMLIVSPDPVAFEARQYPANPPVALARRTARLERTLLLRRLARAGIQVIDWDVRQPFDQAAHTALSRLPHSLQPAAETMVR
jgi:uncharacterized protein (DUF58 family)